MLGLTPALLAFHTLYSQSSQFKNYSVNEGLPSSEAYNVMQDSKGYMWFCTDGGVSRFDGYSFKVFNTNNGLPDNEVFEAKEDYKGRIWFRSYSGKLSYYYQDSIFRLGINDTLPKYLKTCQVSSLAVDSSDNLYLGMCGYLNPLRIDLKHDNTFSLLPSDKGTTYIYEIPRGGVINGVWPYVYPSLRGSKVPPVTICRLNPKTSAIDTTQVFERKETEGTDMHDKSIKLNDGNIALSISSTFLLLGKDRKPVFSHFFYTVILNIVADKQNRIWIIPNEEEPLCYENGEIKRYPQFQFLKNKHITAMYVDNEGGLWFTSLDHGVYYLNSLEFKTWSTDNGLPGNKVNILSIAPDSTMWVGTYCNTKITLLHNDSITYFDVPHIPGISVNDILFNTDRSIWVSTSNGLFIYPEAKSFSPSFTGKDFTGKDELLDSAGRVWLNTHNEVYLMEKKNNAINVLKAQRFNGRIFKMAKDGSGGLWVATTTGLWNYHNDSLDFSGNKLKELNSRFGAITVSQDGLFWGLAYSKGVIVKSGDNIYHIDESNGLINNFCTSICNDSKGRMWIGTRKGLSCISYTNSGGSNFQVQSVKNIRASELNEVNCIKCIGNIIYAGTNNGLISFNMDDIKTESFQPPIYITGLSINDKLMQPSPTLLNLNHDENNVLINYTGLGYKEAGNLQYRYKMDGLDTGWVYTKSISVSYPKLSPGNYTFLVNAMNYDGTWSIQSASLSFNIKAAWWNTWWARITGLTIIIGLVFWRIRNIQMIERQKSETSRQLAIAELQKLKAQFDPHFLFNNLNTLSSLIDASPASALEFVDELSQFYHYNIRYRKEELSQLEAEIEYAKRYYNLLSIRFGDLLHINWAIDKKHNEYFILTNSLQVLMENVVKHNNILADKHIIVEIKSTIYNSIIISNDIYPRLGVTSSGIGISSINERYRLLCNKEISVKKTNEYFSVELPLISPNEYEYINNRG